MASMHIFLVLLSVGCPASALQHSKHSHAMTSCDQCVVEAWGGKFHSSSFKIGRSVGAGTFNYGPDSPIMSTTSIYGVGGGDRFDGISSINVSGDGCEFLGYSGTDLQGSVKCLLFPGEYTVPSVGGCGNDQVFSWQVKCQGESPGSPTPAPPCDPSTGTCTISEDPHIEVFDGTLVAFQMTDAYTKAQDGAGDKWLVKTSLVSIQAKYMPSDELLDRKLFVRAIAVGGAFLKGNTIVIGSLEDQATWNGKPILEYENSSFEFHGDDYSVSARRGEHSSLVQDLSKENAGVNIELPLGVSLVVNRLLQHVNTAIKMPKPNGIQEGLCGNFNGLAGDDTLEFSSNRFDPTVPPEDSLFAGLTFSKSD